MDPPPSSHAAWLRDIRAPGSGPGSYAETHGVLAPLLRADASAAMLNFEIADHPVYHGLELQ